MAILNTHFYQHLPSYIFTRLSVVLLYLDYA